MVLLYSKEGQLANRLWQASFFIANSIEHNYQLLHLGFAEYFIYFGQNKNFHPARKEKWKLLDFKATSKWHRFIIKYANSSKEYHESHNHHFPFISELTFFDFLPGAKGYDITQEAFLLRAKRHIFLVDGWQFTDHDSLTKHAGRIREIFTPNRVYTAYVERLTEQCYSKYDCMIGVHIRKGDYKSFNEGKWFFSNADYASFMKQVTSLPFLVAKKVAFLLCSDEQINHTDFAAFDIMTTRNNFIEDLYALSFCDFIIGPPSTYSAWAAFYGQKPLLHFTHGSMDLEKTGFRKFGENI